MLIDQLETKLLSDIEIAYSEAISKRFDKIETSINELIASFTSSNLSLFGIANLEMLHDFSKISYSENLPFFIKIGYFVSKKLLNKTVQIPIVLDLEKTKGLNICTDKKSINNAYSLAQNIALRFVLSLPENLINIKIFDAASNGSNFSFLLALDKSKTNLFTNELEISNKLNEIVNNFTKTQTEKLTFQYQSIEEYNKNNNVKEPYQLLLISNYPDGFLYRRDSVQALKKIIENGLKYGVIALIVSDLDLLGKQNLGFSNEIDNLCGKVTINGNTILSSSLIDELIISIEYAYLIDNSIPSNKLEIISFLNKRKHDFEETEKEKNKKLWDFDNFYTTSKAISEFWKSSSIDFAFFPLGFPINYTPTHSNYSFFHLGSFDEEGKGNKIGNYHCLIGGETGSGKSVLINNLIINSCYLYSPNELQFIIIDLKGNEYPEFINLPHIKVLFQDPSKIDIALNVLEFVKKQYEDRTQLFKKAKINEFAQFRQNNELPRIVCIIDEFQTFNQSANLEVKRKSAEIIDLIVGKGRSYGIHLILASQSLSNVNINPASMTNINVRLVLRLDESSSRQILSISNNETLKFPDLQLVYNNTRGYEKQDNKIIKLPYLKGQLIAPHIEFFKSKLTDTTNYNSKKFLLPGEPNVFFDSNAEILESFRYTQSKNKKFFIGKPYFIKDDDNYFEFYPEVENNLLILGQDLKSIYRLLCFISFQFLSKIKTNQIRYIQYTPKSSHYFGLFDNIEKENNCFKIFQSVDAERIYDELIDEISNRKNQQKIDGDILLILPQLNIDTSLNVRSSPIMSKIRTILETGPIMGIYTVTVIESYNSFAEINTINNLSKFKIATKGGESHRIMPDKKEVDDEGYIYFNGPSPYTVINPDYISVYNSFHSCTIESFSKYTQDLVNVLFDNITDE